MRKVYNVLAVIFILISIVFAILPMGQIAFIPVGIALIFGGLALFISEGSARKFPTILLITAGILLVIVAIRAFTPDEVQQDTEFEQRKAESNEENLKELEELEGLE